MTGDTRLLLDSPWPDGRTVANSSDLVGRHLVDHPQLILGQVIPHPGSDLGALAHLAVTPVLRPGRPTVVRWPNLTTSSARACDPGVARLATTLLPGERSSPRLWGFTNRFPRHHGGRTGAPEAAGRLADAVRSGRFDRRALSSVPTLVSGLDDLVLPYLRRRLPPAFRVEHPQWPDGSDAAVGAFHLLAVAEQLPDPDNRIVLSDHHDVLGGRRVRIHWRWSDADMARADRSADDIRSLLEHLGVGTVRPRTGRAAIHKINSHHAAGTTPMSDRPEDGVVNADLRAHDHPNLYLVGSGVLNCHSYANPTLTDVALGLRLGARLAGRDRT